MTLPVLRFKEAPAPVPEADLPWQFVRESRGSTFFTNAIGAARSGEATGARTAIGQLERLQSELAASPPAGPYDWAGQVESLRLAASGWLAFAEGRADEAVRLLTSAAAREEAVGKHPVTPGAILPAREQLGDILLELGRAPEALAGYESTTGLSSSWPEPPAASGRSSPKLESSLRRAE